MSEGLWEQEQGSVSGQRGLLAPVNACLTLPSSPRSQGLSLVLLLPLLLLLGPTWQATGQRCPWTCVCDNSRRHVACRHQNLTEVPNAIPEVSREGLQGEDIRRRSLGWRQWTCHCLVGDLGKSLFLSAPQPSHL